MNPRRFATARNGVFASAVGLLSLSFFTASTADAAFLFACAALVLSLYSV